MRIGRVYTRTGDRGTTRLVGGTEIGKDHPRIEAYGTVDELNTIVGLARTFNQQSPADAEVVRRIDDMLKTVQNDLFNVGADRDNHQVRAIADRVREAVPRSRVVYAPGGLKGLETVAEVEARARQGWVIHGPGRIEASADAFVTAGTECSAASTIHLR